MTDESDHEAGLVPCPNCGSRDPSKRESETYVLEDGTKRRMRFCTACMRERADGTVRYEVISEEFVRTDIDREMNDSRTG